MLFKKCSIDSLHDLITSVHSSCGKLLEGVSIDGAKDITNEYDIFYINDNSFDTNWDNCFLLFYQYRLTKPTKDLWCG